MQAITILKNTVQEYRWGSLTAIPDLLGVPNPQNTPQAELWMGAHPKSPSQVRYRGRWVSALELIEKNPEKILGQPVARKFGNKMPYLFKVIAVAAPLSLQAHPDRGHATHGFHRENAEKIPLNAPHRNYRDDNHKPECICALTPFWALCGFRKISEIISYFRYICPSGLRNEVADLCAHQTPEGLKAFFSYVMALDGNRRQEILVEATTHARERAAEYPAYQWLLRLSAKYPDDIGILSPILLDLVNLEPGQAMFLGSGQLHAYLGGVGIELMANSDNVLRGGLTLKYVDVRELLTILDFRRHGLYFITPKRESIYEQVYPTPAEEFVLSVILLPGHGSYVSKPDRSIEIVLCTAGSGECTDMGSGEKIAFRKGISILVPSAVAGYRLEGEATLYKAAVPI